MQRDGCFVTLGDAKEVTSQSRVGSCEEPHYHNSYCTSGSRSNENVGIQVIRAINGDAERPLTSNFDRFIQSILSPRQSKHFSVQLPTIPFRFPNQ